MCNRSEQEKGYTPQNLIAKLSQKKIAIQIEFFFHFLLDKVSLRGCLHTENVLNLKFLIKLLNFYSIKFF